MIRDGSAVEKYTCSVIVPTRARPDLLAQAIRSLEIQSRIPDEVVVVDDGSPQPVGQIKTNLTLRLIRQVNSGVAAARNRGASVATGDVVFFLDDDDFFGPNRIAHALGLHAEGHSIVCSAQAHFADSEAPDILARWSQSQAHGLTHGPPAAEVRPAAELLARSVPHIGATSIVRADFDEMDTRYRASQDVEWWVRQAENGAMAAQHEGPDYWFRTHSGTRFMNGSPARLAASKSILQEHADFFDAHRRARSYREARVSLMASGLGDRQEALTWAIRSLRSTPTKPGIRALVDASRPRARRFSETLG